MVCIVRSCTSATDHVMLSRADEVVEHKEDKTESNLDAKASAIVPDVAHLEDAA